MILFLIAAADCFGNPSYVVRRETDPEKKTITETRVAKDFAATIVMDVRGNTYTIRGEASSKGTLSGPEWKWTSWTERIEHKDSAMTAYGEINERGLTTRAEITHGAQHTMGTPNTYPAFACADFDRRVKVLRPK